MKKDRKEHSPNKTISSVLNLLVCIFFLLVFIIKSIISPVFTAYQEND